MKIRGDSLRTPLINCPVCSMDSGYRVRKRKGKDESFLVRCATCGAETKQYGYVNAAARAWNDGRVHKKEKAE